MPFDMNLGAHPPHMTWTSVFGLVAKRSVSFDVPVKRQPVHEDPLPGLYDLTSPALISS